MNKKLKVNRIHFCDPSNIKKIGIKDAIPWIYLKTGFPPILKATEGLGLLKKRLVNIGYTIWDFIVEEG